VYPNASLSSGAKVTQEHSGNAATDGRSTDLSLGVAASYEIDLWGRVRASRDAANLDARSMGEDVRTAAVTLSAQVATTWYGLVRQRGEIAILQRQLRSNEEMLELVMLRFHQGQSKAEDVLRQRQIVEARRGDIARAQANSSVLQHRLAILLGQNPSVEVAQPSTNLAALPPLPSTGVPAELIQRRPDTRRAYFDVLAADRRVAAAVADRFPRLSITAEAATSGGAVTDLFSNWLASLAGNLTMPLVDGGRRIAEVERARAATSASLSNYGQVVLNALGEVEDALITEQRQAEYVASLAQQLSLAGSVIERSRDNYLQGVTEYTRVLDAQQTHQALEITYLGARATQIENRIALYRALSGGWAMTHPETSSSAN
jgi:NodT family efflux transporter outer membrane factor (OMF) lipoprotein